MAPIVAPHELFDEVGVPALRCKSERLTDYLAYLLDQTCPEDVDVITPREPSERGCQLSLMVHDRPDAAYCRQPQYSNRELGHPV
jgi:kynureninase